MEDEPLTLRETMRKLDRAKSLAAQILYARMLRDQCGYLVTCLENEMERVKDVKNQREKYRKLLGKKR